MKNRIYFTESCTIDEAQWNFQGYEPDENKTTFDMTQLKGAKISDKYSIEKVKSAKFFEEKITDFEGKNVHMILNMKTQEIDDVVNIEPILCNNNTYVMDLFKKFNGDIAIKILDDNIHELYLIEISNTDEKEIIDYINGLKHQLDALTIILNFNSIKNNGVIKINNKNSLVFDKNDIKVSIIDLTYMGTYYHILKNNKIYNVESEDLPVITNEGNIIAIAKENDLKLLYIYVITKEETYTFFKVYYDKTDFFKAYKKIKIQIKTFDLMKDKLIKSWSKQFKMKSKK